MFHSKVTKTPTVENDETSYLLRYLNVPKGQEGNDSSKQIGTDNKNRR